jgi:RNA polymerase sigma factor (sigma-70 family)
MQAMDDMALLREYAARNSEAAFETLVSRRVGFVYSAALRQVRDPHLAEEITQAVFIILAHKAGRIPDKTILCGWLFKTTRFAAIAQIRTDAKRRRREQEAQMQTELQPTAPDLFWEQMSPLLDEALATLGETDRQAVLLRFFENKSLAEVGSHLGTGEDPARKRVSRALEKLHRYFSKHGISSTTDALAGAISANSVQVAPAMLAKSITVAAMAKGAAASGSIPALVKGVLKLLAWHNAKAAIITGAAIVVATGATPLLVKAVNSAHTTYPDIQGAWENVEDTSQLNPAGTYCLHEVLKVSKTNGAYRATLDLIELGQSDFPLTAFTYKNGTVRLQISTWDHYEGTVDPTGTEIRGFFMSRNGYKADAVWKRTTHPAVVPPPLAESDYAPTGNSALQGFWEGYATVKGIPLRMNLKISEPSPGNFRAEWDDLDAGFRHIPVTVTYNKPTVKMKLTFWSGRELEATMNSSNTEFRCSMPAGSPDIPWTFKRGHQEPAGDYSFVSKTDLQGHWQGTLKSVDGIKLRLNLHIARLPDGKFSATLDSPDQGSSGALATAVRYRPPEVRIEWVWMKCSFAGKLEHGELSGVFGSTRSKVPVVFQRSDLK